jgi:hypothetical protein
MLRCAAWHVGGAQFMCGYSSGYLVHYRTESPNGTRQRVDTMAPSDGAIYRAVSQIAWAVSPQGDASAAAVVCAGGTTMDYPEGIVIVWQTGGRSPVKRGASKVRL